MVSEENVKKCQGDYFVWLCYGLIESNAMWYYCHIPFREFLGNFIHNVSEGLLILLDSGAFIETIQT
jgi:hypothetical protein